MMEILKQNGLPALDELDLMIVRELEQDARVSYATLASKLGTSPPTVRRRVNRLVDQGIIRIGTISDSAALGYNTALVLGINAPPGELSTLASRLACVDEIKYLWFTAGRYDLLAMALYQNPEEYIRSFSVEVGRILGNGRMETLLSVKTVKRSWSLLTHTDLAATSFSGDIPTDLDLSVIKGLEMSPRITAKDLAENIGASLPAVRSSLRKLTSQGIVRVVCIPDPGAFGYLANGVTLIKVHPSSLKSVTDKLKVDPSVKHMTLTFGAFDCMIWTTFQSAAEMSDFLAQDLGTIPGVMHYESLVCLRLQKISVNLLSSVASSV